MSKNTDEYRALAAKIEKANGELKLLEQVMDGLDADTGLLLASSVPGPIGTIADVASLAKSLAAGDLGGAMWDLVGFVPFFGDAVKAIGKGGKIAKHIAAIKKAIKKAKEAIAKQEKKLEKLCKGKTKKGDVDKATTSSSCPECDGVKNTDDEYITVYRGDRPDAKIIKSKASSEYGYKGAQDVIDNNDLDDLFKLHKESSDIPPSPFISTTSDKKVAEFFAGKDGVVNEFRIPKNRAIFNKHNDFVVPAGTKGELLSESEYLVPLYIKPSEFITKGGGK